MTPLRGRGAHRWVRRTLGLATVLALWVPRGSAAAGAKAIEARDQHALVVEVEAAAVVAKACANLTGCAARGGERFAIPEDIDAARAQAETISLVGGRSVVEVSAPAKAGGGRWTLVLAGSDKPGATAVRRVFRGVVDRPRGNVEGERSVPVLLHDKSPDGVTLVHGWRYENATLCGRPTTLRAQQLDPESLEWVDARTQSLSAAARRDAKRLIAAKLEAPYTLAAPQLLHSVIASSAARRDHSGMTDRQLDTRWSEAKPGVGGGEYVVMTASEEVAVKGFELVVRPSSDPAGGMAPRTFYVVTHQEVFHVTMPSDAWLEPPTTAYRVDLPAPVSSDCVALVLDEAYARPDASEVGVAEFRAVTTFDGASMQQLAAALDGADASAARALLTRSGSNAIRATVEAYPSLSFEGRRRALDVLDGGTCKETAAFWADRLLGKDVMGEFEPETDPVVRRARDRLRTCRQAAALVLAEVLRTAKGKPQVFAARELALLAPRDAIPTIVALLDAADADMRRGLRRALAAAAGSPRAKGAVEAELSGDRFSKRPLRTQIDLLRSLGDGLAGFAGAGAALNRTATSDTTFRSRYLLLGPAACLAAARDPAATAWLKRAIEQDESHHIRAEAARRAGGVAALAPSLSHALQDSQPRVRQGALEALAETGKHADGRAEARAVKLLQGDPWTFVRVEAAHALGGRPRNEAGDRALMNAMEDESPHVRRALLRALGQRKSHIAAQLIHDVANNAKEKQSVRIAAIVALGELCRKDAAPLLYKLALRAGFAQLPYDQPLGLAALAALGDIKPPGLAKQLAPLLGNDKRVPRLVRLIARDVVTREGNCSAKKKPAKR